MVKMPCNAKHALYKPKRASQFSILNILLHYRVCVCRWNLASCGSDTIVWCCLNRADERFQNVAMRTASVVKIKPRGGENRLKTKGQTEESAWPRLINWPLYAPPLWHYNASCANYASMRSSVFSGSLTSSRARPTNFPSTTASESSYVAVCVYRANNLCAASTAASWSSFVLPQKVYRYNFWSHLQPKMATVLPLRPASFSTSRSYPVSPASHQCTPCRCSKEQGVIARELSAVRSVTLIQSAPAFLQSSCMKRTKTTDDQANGIESRYGGP